MAQSPEAPMYWDECGLGKEFNLPNISSRWLTEVFQLWNDKYEAAGASHPSPSFQTGRDMQVPLVESTGRDSKVSEKGVASTPAAGLSPAQTHSQIWSEQQGISSSSVDSSMWDEASAQAEVASSCNAVQGHLNGSERGIYGKGYSQTEVEAKA